MSKNQPATETGLSPTDLLNATRADLSEAQRARSELQERLNRVSTEVEKLRKKSTQDARRVSALENERARLQLGLKDRDEELRGKAKLLEVGGRHGLLWLATERFTEVWPIQDFQDEMATLNLQLNMAEERSTRFQRENQELVDRWMARMGKEVDAMNDASEYS